MAETGTVLSIENGIAIVELPRKPLCGKCGLCLMSGTAPVMHMRAYTAAHVKQGDRVTVLVDRPMRWHAQLWLLALPLAAFIGCAIVAKTAMGWSDGLAALAACGGLALGFGAAVMVDKLMGWSTKPVAHIATEAEAHNSA